MARTPEHPSGAKVSVNIRLSPDLIRVLDRQAERLGLNRSRTVGRLLEHVEAFEQAGSREPAPGTVELDMDKPLGHDHTKSYIKAGFYACDCGAIQGKDSEWRMP